MLIDMDVTIAYKCFSCGAFDFINVNLFKLFFQKGIVSTCKCGDAQMEICAIGKNEYSLTVPCIGCGTVHSNRLSKEDLINNDIKIYTCPNSGIKHCFIGKDEVVREYVDNLQKELDVMMDGLGYDKYFVNTQVMMDTLNKVHDIAEQKRLICECGCNEIMVSLLRKGIFLKCSRCSGAKFISASTNNDLKKTLQRRSITLNERKSKSILL